MRHYGRPISFSRHAAHAHPRRTLRLAAPVAGTRRRSRRRLCAAGRAGHARADLRPRQRHAGAPRAAGRRAPAARATVRRGRGADRTNAAMGRATRPPHPDPGRPRLSATAADHRRPAHPAVRQRRPRLPAPARHGGGGRAQRHARRAGQRTRLRAPPGRPGLVHRQRPGPGHRRGGPRRRAAGRRAGRRHGGRDGHRHRPHLPRRAPRPGAPHRPARRAGQRTAPGHGRPAPPFSAPQPPGGGPGARRPGGRGGAPERLAHHRAAGAMP
ncbi:Uncharacterised protein [Bordetella pertussis]|nr:Uncharacterised protein [Bordetella pertussis]